MENLDLDYAKDFDKLENELSINFYFTSFS